MRLSPGDKIGPYQILAPIGAGGMGEVYRARDSRLAREVAIKVVRADLVDDPQRLRRFQQEARAAAAFHHPNIAVLHEIGQSEGNHFIVMEYVEGQTLRRLIGGRPLPVAQLLDFAVQMADALEEARSKGVVHRDIKPANVLITPKGQAKILDFGLAKPALAPQSDDATATAAEPMTQTGVVMGTIPYMSPEQALGQPADHRSDLFSLGIVIYEMATGKRPFEGPTAVALLNEIINREPAPPVSLNPAFPPALEPVLRKTLEKDPRQRYQTAGDLLSDLKRLQRGAESSRSAAATVTATLPHPSPAMSHSSRLLLMLSAGAAVAAGVWFGFFREASHSPVVQPPAGYNLTQVTRDSGLTYQPSISSDGNFVVYASDRATGTDLDVWIQHVSGGQPVRLTATPGKEFKPSLSADGRRAAFEASGGQQSGIFVVPALGGSPRQVASAGRDARISPDGSSVAFATGWYMQPSEIHVVSADRGSDRKVATGLGWAIAPQWTRDGKQLLLWSRQSDDVPYDYWIVPASGGVAKKTGLTERLLGARSMLIMPFQRDPSPVASATENGMVMAASSGDGHDLWLSPLSSGRADSPAIRITTGAGAANPSVAANGKIAFARLSVSSGLWKLPIQGDSGHVTGEMKRVWRENVKVSHPNLSADGKRLAYVSNRGGDPDVWVRDLTTGTDRQLTSSKFDEYRAVISPDGAQVAFAGPGNRTIVTMPADGGAETVVCEQCGSVQQWTPDGGSLLCSGEQRTRFSILDLKTGQKRDVIWHPEGNIHNGRLSPDGRWVTFTLVKTDSRAVYLASLENAGGKPEAWIRLSGEGQAESSFWSTDGNVVYIYQRDALWARKLHPGTKAPAGDVFLVQRLPGPRFSAIFSANGLAKDSLYFVMEETTSNIWLAEPADR